MHVLVLTGIDLAQSHTFWRKLSAREVKIAYLRCIPNGRIQFALGNRSNSSVVCGKKKDRCGSPRPARRQPERVLFGSTKVVRVRSRTAKLVSLTKDRSSPEHGDPIELRPRPSLAPLRLNQSHPRHASPPCSSQPSHKRRPFRAPE